jgi:hypothetical protein
VGISKNDIAKRLIAKIEVSGNILPDRLEVARRVVWELAPVILVIIREEVKAELRQQKGKEKQQ